MVLPRAIIAGVLLLVLGAQPACAQSLTTNLAGYWAFENNGNDSTANARNFSVTGTMPYITGKLGQGCTPTSTNYFNITNPTWFDSQSAYSIQFWCRDSSVTGATEALVSYGTALATGSNVLYPYNNNSGTGFAAFSKGVTYAHKLTNSLPATGSWQHVVLVVENASSSKLYINGGLESTNTTNSMTTAASQTALRIGTYHNSAQSYTGDFDELGIWTSRALTQTEVTWLYNSGNGRTYAEVVATSARAMNTYRMGRR